MASFNATVRQMTEMFLSDHNVSEKITEMFQRKKNSPEQLPGGGESRTT